MKIGILTYTREHANLGTVMQCYSTLKAVQRAYPDARVELIDYSARAPSRRPYLSNASFRSVKNDCIRILKYGRFFREQLTFSKDTLTSTSVDRAFDFIRRQRYDAIYVGSDTVLELKDAKADALTPYWLPGSIPSIKFLAAASSHNVTIEALSAQQKNLIERALDSFTLLGVRDDATFRLLSKFTGRADKRLQIVPDPTFTYDIDYSYIEQYFAKKKLQLRAPLVCLHLLRSSAWAPVLANAFRKAGYVVASLRPAYYADIIFTDLSPFEQMGVYRYFSLVITHRFHDTIFCLKNLTPVIAFPEHDSDITPEGESKIATLLNAFEAAGTNYISNATMLTAEDLFERHPAAIEHFIKNRAGIKARLLELHNAYTAFIQRSRVLV